jgi:hypothetical protein
MVAACTSSRDPGAGPRSEGSQSTSPPPVTRTDSYVFTDAAGIEARIWLKGETALLTVRNESGVELPEPGVYVLDARDGARIEWRVINAAPIADGESVEFRVEREPEPEAKHIGLVVLLLGGEDLGAFVPPQPGVDT